MRSTVRRFDFSRKVQEVNFSTFCEKSKWPALFQACVGLLSRRLRRPTRNTVRRKHKLAKEAVFTRVVVGGVVCYLSDDTVVTRLPDAVVLGHGDFLQDDAPQDGSNEHEHEHEREQKQKQEQEKEQE